MIAPDVWKPESRSGQLQIVILVLSGSFSLYSLYNNCGVVGQSVNSFNSLYSLYSLIFQAGVCTE